MNDEKAKHAEKADDHEDDVRTRQGRDGTSKSPRNQNQAFAAFRINTVVGSRYRALRLFVCFDYTKQQKQKRWKEVFNLYNQQTTTFLVRAVANK